ncbi:hypothetical protein N9Z85_07595 [Akkermansiaceae bacterium]|jgi:hypothetical protein|nr:hypothetical protein [Akkermansiaceae bacterium]|tara:strand:+ start:3505 stop:3990 length:486 start_codon:yes stop_codon:yes gene_type:complete
MKPLLIVTFLCFINVSFGDDPGKDKIGSLRVEMIFATNEDGDRAGPRGKVTPEAQVMAMKEIEPLRFKYYRTLGVENPEILRSYESWATPLRPSKEMLISFEPLKREGRGRIQMALAYWQSKRKLFQTNPTLVKGKSLYLLGPEWRGGRLIIQVELLELTE